MKNTLSRNKVNLITEKTIPSSNSLSWKKTQLTQGKQLLQLQKRNLPLSSERKLNEKRQLDRRNNQLFQENEKSTQPS